MKYDQFTSDELERLLSATYEINEIFETQDTWQKLILDDEDYRQVFQIQMNIFHEMKVRLIKRQRLIEEQQQINNQ